MRNQEDTIILIFRKSLTVSAHSKDTIYNTALVIDTSVVKVESS